MADGTLIDRLDVLIDTILARGDASPALRDPRLASLARLAADLRHYPSPEYKDRLRAQLERRTSMSATLIAPDIREGFTTVTPYLMVKAPGLVDFLSRVFAAEETFAARGSAGGMHREVRIGDSMIMVGEQGTQEIAARPAALHVYVDDADAAYQRALTAGATSLGAPADRPYGERSGFVRDSFGNHWYIATHTGARHVPHGLRTVTPFVHAPNAGRYIDFLKEAFGAVEEGRHETEGLVRYARLRIGDGALEIGEAEPGAESMPASFYLYVADADRLYDRSITAGATSLWPPSDQPYGDRVGGVTDSLGNEWFIARPAASS
jgi:uncharacterized glyoxalase superfamily protein PhnB